MGTRLIKWDPSATMSYECNRTDHGHGRTDGAYAAYRGRLEIMRVFCSSAFLVFPDLNAIRLYNTRGPIPARRTCFPGDTPMSS